MSQEERHARSANGHWSIVRKLGCPPIHQSTEEETTSNRKSPGQVCGEIRRVVTQSRSAYTLAIPSTKPALYSPVFPRKSRPAESSPGEILNQPRTFRPGYCSPGESSNQPRTSRPGYSSPGENPDLSWNRRPVNTHNHILVNPYSRVLESPAFCPPPLFRPGWSTPQRTSQ